MIRAGQRLAFMTSSLGFQAVLIDATRYYHLNCVPAVTCTAVRDESMSLVTVCPDGWPDDAFTEGFMAMVEKFIPIDAETPVSMGTITDSLGNPIRTETN